MNKGTGVKRFVSMLIVLAAGLAAAAWAVSGSAAETGHPELDEQEMLVACASCHQETTPEIHRQWYDSVHGVAMVKCYQCHGTFENFRISPPVDNCATCHLAMTAPDHAQNKLCWECHAPHLFKIKQ